MKWTMCKLFKRVVSGVDPLGNPTFYDPELVAEIRCRYTSKDDIKTILDGREVNRNEQVFIMSRDKQLIPDFDHAEIDSTKYEVRELIDLGPRWTAIRCVEYEVNSKRRQRTSS